MIGSPVSHRSITGRLAKHTGSTILVPDYRLAPEHPFPAALDDVLTSYRALLAQGYDPKQIAIAGDLAGGGLVLSLCLRLRSEGLAQPACVAVISPWADLTLTRLAPVADDALLRAAWLKSRCCGLPPGTLSPRSIRLPAARRSRRVASNADSGGIRGNSA
jgi:acetyl esterase/lipase